MEPNESWLYRRPPPAGNLVFHFVSRGDVQDFKLVESALDALGFRARFGQAQGLSGVALDLWDSRADLDPMYQRRPSPMSLNDERAQGSRAITVGTILSTRSRTTSIASSTAAIMTISRRS